MAPTTCPKRRNDGQKINMSKRGYIYRYQLILGKLRQKPYSTLEELQKHVERSLGLLGDKDETLQVGYAKRTLERDLKEIRNLFGIDIEYSKSNKGYFINAAATDNVSFSRMIEAFDIFNSFGLVQNLSPFVHLETRRPQGTENLYGLIHAIQNKKRIEFRYEKFWEEAITDRVAEPYALKEFRNRWYVLARDVADRKVKCFALDRMTELNICAMAFQQPASFDVQEYYRYCFGIIGPDNQQPEEIILSFNAFQGKYIKTLKLHENQESLVDDDDEFRVRLNLCITHDFVMELMSYGDNVKVLAPEHLAKEIRAAHTRAVENYRMG